MNPYEELLKIFKGRQQTSGTVVSVIGTEVLVGTRVGTSLHHNGTAIALKPGDTVSIQNGTVVSKLKSEDEIPHYIV